MRQSLTTLASAAQAEGRARVKLGGLGGGGCAPNRGTRLAVLAVFLAAITAAVSAKADPCAPCNPCDPLCDPCEAACNPCEPACDPCEPVCDPCGSCSGLFSGGSSGRSSGLFGGGSSSGSSGSGGSSTGGGSFASAFGHSGSGVPKMIGDLPFWFDGSSRDSSMMGSYPPSSSSSGFSQYNTGESMVARVNLSEGFTPYIMTGANVDWRHFDIGNSGYGATIDRFAFGYEQKLSASSSLQIGLPVVVTESFGTGWDGTSWTHRASEIGNVSLVYKRVVNTRSNWKPVYGLAMSLPTAKAGGMSARGIQVVPHVAMHYNNGSQFGNVLTQFDLPTEKLYTQIWHLDTNYGQWFYQSATSRIGGQVELHVTRSLESKKSDAVFNIAAGLPIQSRRWDITPAIVLPLSSAKDQWGNYTHRMFNSEFVLMINRKF